MLSKNWHYIAIENRIGEIVKNVQIQDLNVPTFNRICPHTSVLTEPLYSGPEHGIKMDQKWYLAFKDSNFNFATLILILFWF